MAMAALLDRATLIPKNAAAKKTSTIATNEESNALLNSKYESARSMLISEAKLSKQEVTMRLEKECKTGPVPSFDTCAPLVESSVTEYSDVMKTTSSAQQQPPASYFGISRTMGENDPSCLQISGESNSLVYVDGEGKSEKYNSSSMAHSEHSFHFTALSSQLGGGVSMIPLSREAMLQNGVCPPRTKLQNADKINTWVTDRLSNVTLHGQTSEDVQVSMTCRCELVTHERLGTESLSPSPALHQSFAPVAPTLNFYNHVPTPCGPTYEFGVDARHPKGTSWHRLQNKLSRDRHLRKWIENARAFQSNIEAYVETDPTQNNWSDIYRLGTTALSTASIPSLSRLVCSKEWEQNFVQRMAASKVVSHDNSGLIQAGGSTW
jgi:hypothetical protein